MSPGQVSSLNPQLEAARIPNLPAAGYYLPDFITVEEEAYLLDEIQRLPASRWTELSHRRLISSPSQLTGSRKDTLVAAELPRFLERPILPRLAALNIFAKSPHGAPNHCLVNEYQPGEGIMPHTDGPAYDPITATVSLGSHTVLDIYEKNDSNEGDNKPEYRILQEPRSLLVTVGDMYKHTLHGIAENFDDEQLNDDHIANWNLLGQVTPYEQGRRRRDLRISLTYRDVLKVAKLGGAMKFITKR